MCDTKLIEAIDRIIAKTPEKLSKNGELIDVLMQCKAALTEVSYAVETGQARPKSHWGLRHYVDGNLDMSVCRNCDHEYSFDAETGEAAEDYYNFCPNCGADMREEVNGD